ncbi:MAG: alpha/beta hydrolase [Marinomonas sp.]
MTKKYPLSALMTDFVRQSQSFFPEAIIQQGIDAQRVAYGQMTASFASVRPKEITIEDSVIAGISVRHYRPDKLKRDVVVLFAHGGGWYLGDVESHDSFCAHLASDCGVELIAIDYALAPESPFPEGLNNIEQVYQFLLKNNSSSILLMGDSAGANLMAALSLRCRRKGWPLAYAQCFIYPAFSEIGSLPSHLAMSDAPLLDIDSLHFCYEQYAPSSPTLYKEELMPLNAMSHAGLPPTMLFAAQYDPLIDDARCYQQALQNADVPVKLTVIDGLVHGGLHGFKLTFEGKRLYTEVCHYVESLTQ